jgi:16S rRNA (uracil1498-N3)-methyltransferase
MELYYSNEREGNQLMLDEDESHHCLKVIRHRAGDDIMVTDGLGKLFRTKITGEQKRQVTLEIVEITREERSPAVKTQLIISPLKNNDRLEWLLEKSTEIGVIEIVPVICTRTEKDKLKLDRLRKILVSAMKQSLQLWLPVMMEPVKFPSLIARKDLFEEQRFICHCHSKLPHLKTMYQPGKNVSVLIGPEGDFTTEEINLAERNGFMAAGLGTSRLRTETAGIVAALTVQIVNNGQEV